MDARRGRPTAVIELSGEERETLERWARRPKSSQALVLAETAVCGERNEAFPRFGAQLPVTRCGFRGRFSRSG